jgi:hypothetical protein
MLDSPSTSNRRSSPRWNPRANVTAEVYLGAEGGQNIGCYPIDISVGGACVIVSQEVLPGEPIRVVLRAYVLPSPLRVTGIVRRCVPAGGEEAGWCLGVAFDRPLRYRDIHCLFGR